MTMSNIISKLPDFARDIRLNLETVLSKEGAPGLSEAQIGGVALACGYSLGNRELNAALENDFGDRISPEIKEAAKSAATIMGMNNIYYRFMHLAEDPELAKLPARLRMTIIGKPGIDKTDFELMCLAVSAIEGCGRCITSHVAEVRKGGVTDEGIQSSIRIASVLHAARQALAI